MTRTLAVHSHGGGSGKSTLAVNLAALLARDGNDVCLVDTDVQAPGLHVLAGVESGELGCTLSDYLLGRCDIESTVHDVTHRLGPETRGRLNLVPSRLDAEMITRIVGGGYDAGLLDEGLRTLVAQDPDLLILDTQAGMTNETMVALAAADAVVIIIRADAQDYPGAAVATAVAHTLNCPYIAVVVSMTAAGESAEDVRRVAEDAYGSPVTAVIPNLPELAGVAEGQIFVVSHPEHDLVETLRDIAEHLLGVRPGRVR